MPDVPQYLTFNYTTEPSRQKQHGTDTKADRDLGERREDPEGRPRSDGHEILDRGAEDVLWKKDGPSHMVLAKLDIHTGAASRSPSLTLCRKNSKWTRDLS
jgi:hypothetical protein